MFSKMAVSWKTFASAHKEFVCCSGGVDAALAIGPSVVMEVMRLVSGCVRYHRGTNAGVNLSPWMSLLFAGRGFLPVLGGWLVGAVPAVLFHIEVGDFR